MSTVVTNEECMKNCLDPNPHYISAKELSDVEKELGEWVNKLNSNAKKGIQTEAEFNLSYHFWNEGLEVTSTVRGFPRYNNLNEDPEE